MQTKIYYWTIYTKTNVSTLRLECSKYTPFNTFTSFDAAYVYVWVESKAYCHAHRDTAYRYRNGLKIDKIEVRIEIK